MWESVTIIAGQNNYNYFILYFFSIFCLCDFSYCLHIDCGSLTILAGQNTLELLHILLFSLFVSGISVTIFGNNNKTSNSQFT